MSEDRLPAVQGFDRAISLGSLLLSFLKIGITAFSGFMVLISVVQNYVFERSRLLKHEDVLDGFRWPRSFPNLLW